MAVQKVMQVCGISTISVTIGEVTMAAPLSDERLAEIQGHLQRLGFELLSDPKKQMVERICTSVLEWVNMTNDRLRLSVYLQDRLAHEYSALSKFSIILKAGLTDETYFCIRKEVRKRL